MTGSLREGIAGEGRTLELPGDGLPLRDLELTGSAASTTAVWAGVVGLPADGLVDSAPIVTHRFAAAEFERAVALLERRQGGVGKVVLEHPAP